MNARIGKTGLFVGSLYDGRHGEEIPVFIPDEKAGKKSFLYDEGSGNLHLFPEDVRLAEALSEEYGTLRLGVIERIKGTAFRFFPRAGANVWICRGTRYKDSKQLFCYIRIQAGDLLLDLTFFRFFRETRGGETFVSCMARTPQVKVYPAGGSEPHSLSHYPDSGEDGVDNGVYYNLPCSDGAGAEEIAGAFLAFAERKRGEAG